MKCHYFSLLVLVIINGQVKTQHYSVDYYETRRNVQFSARGLFMCQEANSDGSETMKLKGNDGADQFKFTVYDYDSASPHHFIVNALLNKQTVPGEGRHFITCSTDIQVKGRNEYPSPMTRVFTTDDRFFYNYNPSSYVQAFECVTDTGHYIGASGSTAVSQASQFNFDVVYPYVTIKNVSGRKRRQLQKETDYYQLFAGDDSIITTMFNQFSGDYDLIAAANQSTTIQPPLDYAYATQNPTCKVLPTIELTVETGQVVNITGHFDIPDTCYGQGGVCPLTCGNIKQGPCPSQAPTYGKVRAIHIGYSSYRTSEDAFQTASQVLNPFDYGDGFGEGSGEGPGQRFKRQIEQNEGIAGCYNPAGLYLWVYMAPAWPGVDEFVLSSPSGQYQEQAQPWRITVKQSTFKLYMFNYHEAPVNNVAQPVKTSTVIYQPATKRFLTFSIRDDDTTKQDITPMVYNRTEKGRYKNPEDIKFPDQRFFILEEDQSKEALLFKVHDDQDSQWTVNRQSGRDTTFVTIGSYNNESGIVTPSVYFKVVPAPDPNDTSKAPSLLAYNLLSPCGYLSLIAIVLVQQITIGLHLSSKLL